SGQARRRPARGAEEQHGVQRDRAGELPPEAGRVGLLLRCPQQIRRGSLEPAAGIFGPLGMTAEIEMSPAGSRAAFAMPAPLRLLDRGIGLVTETLAAFLVVVEILVLLSGVIARYAFHSPIAWSDEVASILFLWLTMLGAVIALRRDEHMRFTVLVSK